MTDLARSTCPTCGSEVSSKYCPVCGEKRLGTDDLAFRHLLEQAIETISNTDGRVFGSVRNVALRPGSLTASYMQGRRKPYIGPLQLFLLANVLFFAIQSLTGWRVFSTPLDTHLHDQFHSGLARRLTNQRLVDRQTTFESYARVFNQAAAVNAKSFIILMVPPFALFAWLLFRRRDRRVVTHAVFALHFFAFVLLFFCVLLPVAMAVARLPGIRGSDLDGSLGVLQASIYVVYLYIAVGTAYRMTGFARVLKVVALTAAAAAILFGYRFVVFLITFYST